MSTPFTDALRLYEYALPPEYIAQSPASPRDAAGLLVYDRASKRTDWTTFRDIGDFLPKNAVLVMNETKVIPAKLPLSRATGGRVSALAIGTTDRGVRVMANRKLKMGETLRLSDDASFTVIGDDGCWLLQPSFPLTRLQEVLERSGTMPLPPYIKHTPLSDEQLRREYQSVFAKNPGSIAAPTASLQHFTTGLLKNLEARGIRTAFVTLHVHLGTFAPLTEEQWSSGKLHSEHYAMPPETAAMLNAAKREGSPIVAVGTTSVRTLESAADDAGAIVRPAGTTDLFIREGYRFKFVDQLITNFHVPKSSLLMLVSAFAGREIILDLYKQAIEKRFRFFSFGDAMLIR